MKKILLTVALVALLLGGIGAYGVSRLYEGADEPYRG